jgi:hypothetical protein
MSGGTHLLAQQTPPAVRVDYTFFFLLLILAAIVLCVVALGVLRHLRRRHPLAGFPVISPATDDGPGDYRIAGVDRSTRDDREIIVQARSRANAQVKAELEGVVVTAVEKLRR